MKGNSCLQFAYVGVLLNSKRMHVSGLLYSVWDVAMKMQYPPGSGSRCSYPCESQATSNVTL